MDTILTKERLSETVWRYRLHSPRIAKKRLAGQFVIIRPTSESERIPLTIANADAALGWIEIIFQVVGKSTMLLADVTSEKKFPIWPARSENPRISKISAAVSASAAGWESRHYSPLFVRFTKRVMTLPPFSARETQGF